MLSETIAGETPPRRSRVGLWIAVILAIFFFLCTVILFGLWVVTAGAMFAGGVPMGGGKLLKETVSGAGQDELLLLPVRGIIMGEPGRAHVRGSSASVQIVRDQLNAARDDNRIKGVILAIDSPGGGITACDVMYNDLIKFREGGKPIVAYLGNTAASGGYYIACAGDAIIAHPASLTGSIGVIMPTVSLEGLFTKIGVKVDPVKSGEWKDIGSIHRDLSLNEKQYLQGIVEELYGRFTNVVRDGMARRGQKCSDEDFALMTNGAPFTGRRAAEKGFVDDTGYLEDAVGKATTLAGLSRARLVVLGRPPSVLETLLIGYGGTPLPDRLATAEPILLETYPRFYYMWTTGSDILLSSFKAGGILPGN